jgi:hypothetical protein
MCVRCVCVPERVFSRRARAQMREVPETRDAARAGARDAGQEAGRLAERALTLVVRQELEGFAFR